MSSDDLYRCDVHVQRFRERINTVSFYKIQTEMYGHDLSPWAASILGLDAKVIFVISDLKNTQVISLVSDQSFMSRSTNIVLFFISDASMVDKHLQFHVVTRSSRL